MIQINVPQHREFKGRPPNVVAVAFMLVPALVGIALTVWTELPVFAIV